MNQRGAASAVMLALAMVALLLGAGIGAVGQYLAARMEAATAADAAALAAAPVTFASFGAEGTPAEEAALFAQANGARLVVCLCPLDRSWAPRTVEVEVERTVKVLVFGHMVVTAASRAEFIPTRLLKVDLEALIRDPRLVLSARARQDLVAGLVDPRVSALLAAVLERHSVSVGVFVTGHALHVRGTGRVSNHHYGRAMDISVVDGAPVRPESSPARALSDWLAAVSGPLRPSEVGTPFPDLSAHRGFFSDSDHLDHLHIGYDEPLS